MVCIKNCGRECFTVSKYYAIYRILCTACTTHLLRDVFIDINYCSGMFRLQLPVIFRELASLSTCTADVSPCVAEILHFRGFEHNYSCI